MFMDKSINIKALDKEELISLVNTLIDERDKAISERDTSIIEIDKLRALIAQQKRALFGARSEKLDPDQMQLGLEDCEQSLGTAEAAQEANEKRKPEAQRTPRSPRKNNRGALPAHLPREHVTIEPEDKSCPECRAPMHVIGEDVAEQLDFVPAQFKVKVIHRPRYGCRCCECAPVQALAPDRPIDGGMATEALLAHVLVSKYGDHLPLYRQCQIYSRQGIDLDRSTLANWVGRSCWWLKPLQDRLLAVILASTKIFADDTTVPVLDPGRGRTKTGRLWAYARDDRPWQGTAPPAVAYVYTEDRKGVHPITHLTGFNGVLQVDGYSSFEKLARERADGGVTVAHCWSHTRRKFFELHKGLPPSKSGEEAVATEALRRIAALYAIEGEIRGLTAEERRAARQERSKPLVDELHPWLAARLEEISGKSDLAKAIRYAIGHWLGLCVFLADGRVEMDTNTVERSIRPIKLTKKNTLFAGSDGGGRSWACVASLIETCKLNGVEPYAYLQDILQRLVAGHPINRVDELLPWNWKATSNDQQPAELAAARS
jgi:transposase